MIEPIKEHNIPLRVKNVFQSEGEGTIIHKGVSNIGVIKAVTSISGIALSADRSGSLSEIIGLVDRIFSEKIETHAEVMIASQSSSRSLLTFVTPTSAGPDATRKVLDALTDNISENTALLGWAIQSVIIITIIGVNLNYHAGAIANILKPIDNISILGYAQGASNCSFSVVLEPENGKDALQRIHTHIINTA